MNWIEELAFRVHCCREAGGSVQNGTAQDGYHDIPSLRASLMPARNRVKELSSLVKQSRNKPQFKEDEIVLSLIREHDELVRIIQEGRRITE